MKIAVVGTGVAGLGAAYALSRVHEVELFEANSYAGGHVNTIRAGRHRLDTGFIVHNEANYPQLTRLFVELEIATNESEMSFSVACGCGLIQTIAIPTSAGSHLRGAATHFCRGRAPTGPPVDP